VLACWRPFLLLTRLLISTYIRIGFFAVHNSLWLTLWSVCCCSPNGKLKRNQLDRVLSSFLTDCMPSYQNVFSDSEQLTRHPSQGILNRCYLTAILTSVYEAEEDGTVSSCTLKVTFIDVHISSVHGHYHAKRLKVGTLGLPYHYQWTSRGTFMDDNTTIPNKLLSFTLSLSLSLSLSLTGLYCIHTSCCIHM